MIKKIESLEDYKEQYQKSVESPEHFWSEIANTFSWRKTWDHVVDWDFKELDVKWFSGARLNITDCLLYTSPSPRDVEESRMPSSA